MALVIFLCVVRVTVSAANAISCGCSAMVAKVLATIITLINPHPQAAETIRIVIAIRTSCHCIPPEFVLTTKITCSLSGAFFWLGFASRCLFSFLWAYLATDCYLMPDWFDDYLTNRIPRSLQIFRASKSLISVCRGTEDCLFCWGFLHHE